MIFGIFRISGHSMMPHLKPNDRIIISSISYLLKNPQIGDVVIFRYNNKTLIKRIVRISNGEFCVGGDNRKDSLKINAIERNDILGKVILKLAVS
ncbi:MAG: signal peptidase I [Candidatus Levybacteria bacterium RIFCSPLOWO2_02_FULL_41_11]|nr:MAG: signal peptidase I [Candidatus Levybacteria bacterium RIFCSPLOWO2_02_FULL_41_11]